MFEVSDGMPANHYRRMRAKAPHQATMISATDTEPETPTLEDPEQSGVEAEPEDERLPIQKPFDPEKIKVRTVQRSIDLIVTRINHDEIDLAPDFQRKFVWTPTRKSRLVESLLLRIPLPVFYVAEDAKENWAVVDGLQRLTTINAFANDSFPLKGLEYLLSFEDHKYSALPRHMQRRIRETELVINVIEHGTPEEVMFNIFFRINTGGVKLNGQEIRHALHKGPVRAFLKRLAETPEFVAATNGTVSPDRMADRECVLRFLAFSMHPWQQYTSSDLDGFLSTAMRELNDLGEARRTQLQISFLRAMRSAKEIFGASAFRKQYRGRNRTNPVSKALFEAWSVELSRRSDKELRLLEHRHSAVLEAFLDLMTDDREFDESISYSTGTRQRVEKRFSAIEQLIDRALT
jgi:hypothetical protein